MTGPLPLLVAAAGVAVVVAALALTGAGRSLVTRAGGLWRPADTVDMETHAPQGPAPAPAPALNPHEAIPRVEVTLDTRRQQLAGVRITRAARVLVTPEIRATGTVAVDETRQAEINTKVDGWVRNLRADYTGRMVTRGEVLFTLYSPDLLAAQNEFLLAHRGHARALQASSPEVREFSIRLVEAARERLQRLDLTADEIAQIEQRGQGSDTVPFRSTAAGVIVEKRVVEGQRVMAGEMLFRLADLSSVWVEAEVYEQDMALVRIGQTAAVTLDTYPGERFTGRLTYIYPFVEPSTRTTRVRFQFANARGRLRPGMFATVELAVPATSAVSVPADAVLDSGSEQVVFVAQGDGYFEPRRVKIGRRTGDAIEILAGLEEGEQVATGATFFLDSESQLRAAAQGFQAPQAASGDVAARDRLQITFRPQPDPPTTGDNMLEVTVKDASGRPIPDADVTVTFFMAAMPSMNMPAMRNEAKLRPVGAGVYRGPGQVVMAGRWDVTVTVSRGGERLGMGQFTIVAR